MGGNATRHPPETSARVRFGVHTPLQHATPTTLTKVWRTADSSGFDWISVWDHFVPVTPLLGADPGDGDNHEAVAMQAALAVATTRARVACLVYNVAYRSAAVIAKAAATIDHLSSGRAVVGLGAGYLQLEYERFGIPFFSAARRSSQLEESVREVRHLLDDVVQPTAVQTRLPIFVGGGGERRTIPTAGAFADGWNVPMATPEDFAQKNALLTRCAVDAGRDPALIERTVSLGLCFDERLVPERFGARWQQLAPAILSGSTQRIVDKIASYVDAGAETIILSLRHPYDTDDIERFSSDVMGAFT